MENLKAVLEALILASDIPLSAVRIKEVLGIEKNEVTEAIGELVREYNERRGGICLLEVAGGFQFRTHPDMGAWVKKLKGGKPTALSQPALETLAIIAYRQPVVKADIERMRGGVDVSSPLKGLLDKKLVKMVGRKDVPGKPMLYGTTKKFLEIFNLNDLSELPTLRELKELQDKYEEKRSETYDFEEMNLEPGEAQPPGETPEQEASGELTELDEKNLDEELASDEAALEQPAEEEPMDMESAATGESAETEEERQTSEDTVPEQPFRDLQEQEAAGALTEMDGLQPATETTDSALLTDEREAPEECPEPEPSGAESQASENNPENQKAAGEIAETQEPEPKKDPPND